jgi:hypothetical protein
MLRGVLSSLTSLEPGPDGRARVSFIEELARIRLRGLPLGQIWRGCSRRPLSWPSSNNGLGISSHVSRLLPT